MRNRTPGPWASFNRDGSRIFKQWGVQGANGKRVCWVENSPECDKDAALIAAAPDLLEACREAKAAMGRIPFATTPEAPHWQEPMLAAYAACESAIAKAEGGAA